MTIRTFAFLTFLLTAFLVGQAVPADEPVANADTPQAQPDLLPILIEAEQFNDYGGWIDDSQFIDQMGSTFLLAHGLGKPVEDATTTVRIPEEREYRVYVRTRDWVAPWNAPGAPGRFQLLINGKPLETTFGTEGADWHWQDGGTIKLPKGDIKLALHDLTGFEGRCDKIMLVPPEYNRDRPAPRFFGISDAGEYDLVVVGGGIAGTCAAISGARNGLKVALIQDRPVLGGNNSSEVRVWLQGARNKQPYPHVGDIVARMEQAKSAHYGPTNTAEIYEDQKKIDLVEAEENIDLRLMHRATAVQMDGDRIVAVLARHTRSGKVYRFKAKFVADCTGDGCIGHLAGADCEIAPQHMGRCNLWNVEERDTPQPFPRCPWAIDLSDKPFPGRANQNPLQLGGWYWESGFDHDPFEKSEYIRDWNFRAAYGAWDALKNVDGAFPNHALNWMAHVSGKRESRRILGDVILTQEDLLTGKAYEDGCVPTGWKIDVHIPDTRYDKTFEGDAFISKALFTDYRKPYWVPYRCLYSRNIENLFMAGRDISVTHQALGATRVMRTGGCMGEIVGMAASLCVEHDTTPRGVYADHLDDLKQLMRTPPYAAEPLAKPRILKGMVGDNVAIDAEVTVSGCKDDAQSADLLNDGRGDTLNNASRWVSSDVSPAWAVFEWDKPETLSAARIISGYRAGEVIAPIEDFVLQYEADGLWSDIPGTETIGNTDAERILIFDPVEAKRVRLLVTKAKDGYARVWEVELYEAQ